MAPSKNTDKSSGPTAFEARVAALHTYLLGTLTAHTLKDLEKSLPSAVSGISGMNAKDHIQALVDEGLLRVEKIGTGNWYWCFGSDARLQRDRVREQLSAEFDVVRGRVEQLRGDLQAQKVSRAVLAAAVDDEDERELLTADIAVARSTVLDLEKALSAYEDGDPAVLQSKRERIREMKAAAEIWTENCWNLEGYMRTAFGMSRDDSTDVLKECYGREYHEEDGGLTEII